MNQSKSTSTGAHTLKTIAATCTICVLWLIAIVLAYSSFSNPNLPWYWQFARSVPGLIVAVYVSGILLAWLRYAATKKTSSSQ